MSTPATARTRKKLTPEQLVERRHARAIAALASRLYCASKIGQEVKLWTWSDPPAFIATTAAMAHLLGGRIEVAVPPDVGTATPQKLSISYVRRVGA